MIKPNSSTHGRVHLFAGISLWRAIARATSSFALVAIAVVLLAAGGADAARKKRKPKGGKGKAPAAAAIDVAVMPFEGAQSGGDAAADAIELELELLDGIKLQDAAPVAAKLASAPASAWAPAKLAIVMKGAKLGALVRGVQVGTGAATKIHLYVFAADGKPHLYAELAPGSADAVAALALAKLKPLFAKWSTSKVVKAPAPPGALKEPVAAPADPKVAKGEDAKKPDGAATTPEATPGEGTTTTPPVTTVEGDEPVLADRTLGGRLYFIEASLALAMGPYGYAFAAAGGLPNPASVLAPAILGGRARVEVWPMHWLGVESNFFAGFVNYRIESGEGLAISPENFLSVHLNGGAVVKARKIINPPAAAGPPGAMYGAWGAARLGYKYWSASAEEQKIEGTGQTFTIIPGFTFQGPVLGVEGGLPFAFDGGKRFELAAVFDFMPFALTAETPDQPGAGVYSLGLFPGLEGRYTILEHVFIDAGVNNDIVFSFWSDEGTRIGLDKTKQDTTTLKGGNALHWAVRGHVGLGLTF